VKYSFQRYACRATDDTVAADSTVAYGGLIQHFASVCNCSTFTEGKLDVFVLKGQKNLIFIRNYQFIGWGGDL
jgi:hypothetical protein